MTSAETSPCSATRCPIRWTPSRECRSASRYRPVRSRCLHPGQQQGRRWPSSSSLSPANAAFSRLLLLGVLDQMNSLRAKGVMSFQAASAVVLAISALRSLRVACAPRHRAVAGCSQGHGSGGRRARVTIPSGTALPPQLLLVLSGGLRLDVRDARPTNCGVMGRIGSSVWSALPKLTPLVGLGSLGVVSSVSRR